jgi:hypothetical protein
MRLAFTHALQLPAARDSNIGSGNQGASRLSALAYPNDVPIHSLADVPPRLLPTDIGCGALATRSQPGTATPTACDSNLDSSNHGMSRLSAFAYLNDAPIKALPTYLYACSQRLLGVLPCPLLPDQTHSTPQLPLNWRSHAQKTICVQLLSIFVTARASAQPPLPAVHYCF